MGTEWRCQCGSNQHDALNCADVDVSLLWVQSGEDAEDALSGRSFFAKEPLIIGLSCGKLAYEDTPPCTLSPFDNARSKSLRYGVATISRLLKIIGLFCKRAL